MRARWLIGFALAGALAAQVPAGFVVTSFFGTPIVMPLLATYMANWEQTVENQSILSLINQGDNSPAALSAEALAVANAFCAGTTNAPVPDCANASATVAPFQQAILIAASTVPAAQWNAATWQPQIASTIAIAVAVSAAAVPPPAPPAGPLVSLPCPLVGAVTMCYPGSGASAPSAAGIFSYLGSSYGNGSVIEYQGVRYVAHVAQGLMGMSLWFSPVETSPTAQQKQPPVPPRTPRPGPCPDGSLRIGESAPPPCDGDLAFDTSTFKHVVHTDWAVWVHAPLGAPLGIDGMPIGSGTIVKSPAPPAMAFGSQYFLTKQPGRTTGAVYRGQWTIADISYGDTRQAAPLNFDPPTPTCYPCPDSDFTVQYVSALFYSEKGA